MVLWKRKGGTVMCKYAKSNGIVVKNAQERATINKVLLESQNSRPAASKCRVADGFNPKLWEVKKNS